MVYREDESRGNVRPKLSMIELQMIYEAMEKAGYSQEGGPRGKLYWRFYHLKSGSHTKGRTHSRRILQEYEDREARIQKTMKDLAEKDPGFKEFLQEKGSLPREER